MPTSREAFQHLLNNVDDVYRDVYDDDIDAETQAIVIADLDEAADALRAAIDHLRGSSGGG